MRKDGVQDPYSLILISSSGGLSCPQDAGATTFILLRPTRRRGKLRHGLGRRAQQRGAAWAPRPTFPPRRQRGGDGAGDNRGPHRGPGSRPQAASPSARASSGCSPPRTPARRWLTAPCGAAGERARGRAGPGRGRSCGAAAEARDARAGGDPVTLARARTRTRTRAHPLALPHAADVPFLNLRNVFLCASERASERARRGRGGGSARARQVTPLPPGPPSPRRPRPLAPPHDGAPPHPPPRRGPRAAVLRSRPAGLIWRRCCLALGRSEILIPRRVSLNAPGDPERPETTRPGWADEERADLGGQAAHLLRGTGGAGERTPERREGGASRNFLLKTEGSRSGLRGGVVWPVLSRRLPVRQSVRPLGAVRRARARR